MTTDTAELAPTISTTPTGPDITAAAGRGASVVADPAAAAALDKLLDAADALVPMLREEQEETERRRYYGEEIHQRFAAAGLYDIVRPKRYGGLELGVGAFNRVAVEVARGDPSAAWGYAQAVYHNLIIASYFPEQAQEEVFGRTPHVLVPASAQGIDLEVAEVEGGIRISGTYQYSSGSPYSTHFLGILGAGATGSVPRNQGFQNSWFLADRCQYEVLDDWGAVMGLKGSGSQSVVFSGAFIPSHRIVDGGWVHSANGSTVGSRLHGNGVFAGVFQGLDEPGIAAGAVGAGYAAIEEYERLIRGSRLRGTDRYKVDIADHQRTLGMALAWVDMAAATVVRAGQLYDEFARLNHDGVAPFTESKALRLHEMGFAAERLVYKAIIALMRSAGSSSVVDGTRLQRYFRDVTTMTTRVDQFEFDALFSAKAYLGTE